MAVRLLIAYDFGSIQRAEFNCRFNRRYDGHVAKIRLRLHCSENTVNAGAFPQVSWGVLSFIGNQE